MSSPTINKTRVHAVLAGQAVFGLLLIWLMSGWIFSYTTDSLIYISTASHIASFHGLIFNNIFVEPPMHDVLPVHLAPPGYPIIVALLKWLGVNEYAGALCLSRGSFAFLPFLFFYIWRRWLPEAMSLVAAGLCSLSLVVLECSVMAWSDVPYLVLALSGILTAFRILEQGGKARWPVLMLCGSLAGGAFMMRYVGVSLILTLGAGFIAAALFRLVTFKECLRILFLYGLGVALPVVPFLIRNVLVFGTVCVPLEHPDFAVFLAQAWIVLKCCVLGLSKAVFGLNAFWPVALFLILFLAGALVWCLRRLRRERRPDFLCLGVVAAYFFFYLLFLVNAKAVAFLAGNLDVDERVMMQVAWIMTGTMVFLIHGVLQKRAVFLNTVVARTLVYVFIFVQFLGGIAYYQKQVQIKELATVIGRYFPNSIPAEDVIVSNVPDITYYYARRPVRALAGYSPESLKSILGPYRKYVVFLVKNSGHLSPAWRYVAQWRDPAGYKRLYSDRWTEVFIPTGVM